MKQSIVLLLSSLVACSGTDLDVGHDPPVDSSNVVRSEPPVGGAGGLGGSGGAMATPPPLSFTWPEPEGCATDPGMEDLLGTWEGQIEDFYLAPVLGVRIVINGVTATSMCGTVTYGDGEPLLPATDPAAAYPSAAFFEQGYGGAPPEYPPARGYDYKISAGAARGKDVRIGHFLTEAWRSWCALQDTFPSPDGWWCVPPEASWVESSRGWSCNGQTYCACEAGGCDANQRYEEQLALTLSDARDELTGTYGGYSLGTGLSYFLKHVE